MTVVFTNETPGCAIVRLSANTRLTDGGQDNGIEITIKLDGSTDLVEPKSTLWTNGWDRDSTRQDITHEWVIPNLPAGTHHVTAEWRLTNDTVFPAQGAFFERILTVTY